MNQPRPVAPPSSEDRGGPKPFKESGALIEALELAFACVKLGPRWSLTEKLKQLGVSKDYYYRRAAEFQEVTGADLTDEIEAEVDAVANRVRNQKSDIFAVYRSLRERHDELRVAASGGLRIRLGAGEQLVRPLVAPALRAFGSYEISRFGEAISKVAVDIGVSGELHEKFARHKVIDLYLSQVPSEPPADAVLSAPTEFPFWVVCPHDHPAAEFAHNHPGAMIPAESFKGTTLLLLGHHPQRSPQYDLPRERIRQLHPGIRLQEVETFSAMHSLLAAGSPDVAALTVPDLLGDEQLRLLTPIPTTCFENFPEIPPLRLCVVRRASPGDTEGDASLRRRAEAVERLAAELEAGLRTMADDELGKVASDWLGECQHIYYERTGETDQAGADRQVSRGWAHSLIRWRVFKSGRVIGRHTVDLPRAPDGTFKGDKTTFDVVGRLTRNPDTPGEFHLLWTGVNDKGEGYAASFVIPPWTFWAGRSTAGEELDPARNVVGVWVGRRTSRSAFQPATGGMVIAFQPDHWQLSATSSDRTPLADTQNGILKGLLDSVVRHEKEYPRLLDGKPARQWEWRPAETAAGRLEGARDEAMGKLAGLVPALEQLVLAAGRSELPQPSSPAGPSNPTRPRKRRMT